MKASFASKRGTATCTSTLHVDGDGLADMQIIVATPSLQASDFLL